LTQNENTELEIIESFDWKNTLIDTLIIALITFFTGLSTLASVEALSVSSFGVLVAICGAEFMGMLAVKRGLRLPLPSGSNPPQH
jgi:hypothetical protein